MPVTTTAAATDYVLLNQDYPAAGALTITMVAEPQNYRLEVFQQQDWNQGYTDDGYAVGSSALDSSGNWLSSVGVPAGIYNVILKKTLSLVVCFVGIVISSSTSSTSDDGCDCLQGIVEVNGVVAYPCAIVEVNTNFVSSGGSTTMNGVVIGPCFKEIITSAFGTEFGGTLTVDLGRKITLDTLTVDGLPSGDITLGGISVDTSPVKDLLVVVPVDPAADNLLVNGELA